MAEFAILPAFAGVCVNDALSVYDGPDYARATHAFCGAHIARELVAAEQADPDNAWPKAALDAFYELNTAAHRARKANLIQIPPDVLDPLLYRWKRALLCGLADNPRRPGVKQSKTRNLLSRLTSRDKQVLLFARDLRVAFTNNLAGRDLRPAKTQLKSPAATAPAVAPTHGYGSVATSPPCAKTVPPSSPDSATPSREPPGPQLQPY